MCVNTVVYVSNHPACISVQLASVCSLRQRAACISVRLASVCSLYQCASCISVQRASVCNDSNTGYCRWYGGSKLEKPNHIPPRNQLSESFSYSRKQCMCHTVVEVCNHPALWTTATRATVVGMVVLNWRDLTIYHQEINFHKFLVFSETVYVPHRCGGL